MDSRTGLALLAVVVIGHPTPSSAQSFRGAADSQRHGIEVIRRGLAAMGGLEAIRRLETVSYDVRLENIALGQAMHPGGEIATSAPPVVIKHSSDLRGERRVFEFFPTDTSSTPISRVVSRPDDMFFLVLAANRVQSVDPAFAEQTSLRLMSFAPSMLLDVYQRAGTVRWLGQIDAHGGTFDVVTYASALGHQVSLFFDANGKLRKTETVESHPQFGDHVSEILFDDFRDVGGVSVPHRITNRIAGQIAGVATFTDVALNAGLDETKLDRPADATEGPRISASPPSAKLEMEEIGPGVYMIPNANANYNVMVSEQDDYVVVLEAPVSPAVSRAVIDRVREAIPGKPIRYVALTHYHFDHSGGLRPYLDRGVTILTTPGNVEFVKSVARAPRTLDGESEGHPPAPRIETVTQTHAFGQGANRLEMYEVGPNPHVDEILIGYFPALKLMYVADLYSFNGTVTAGNNFTLSLADALEELGLEIDIVVPVHGQRSTGENFWESVRLARETS